MNPQDTNLANTDASMDQELNFLDDKAYYSNCSPEEHKRLYLESQVAHLLASNLEKNFQILELTCERDDLLLDIDYLLYYITDSTDDEEVISSIVKPMRTKYHNKVVDAKKSIQK